MRFNGYDSNEVWFDEDYSSAKQKSNVMRTILQPDIHDWQLNFYFFWIVLLK